MIKPNPALNWPIAYEGVLLIARSEGCRLTAYLCPAGVWTIGWGHTEGVRRGDTITQQRADLLLLADLVGAATDVRRTLKVPANENQLGAMVSLVYNIGIGAWRTQCSVLRLHNQGNFEGAARAFGPWRNITVDGKRQVSNGLVARRAVEAQLYLREETPSLRDGAQVADLQAIMQPVLPQAVVADPSPLQGPPGVSGAAATLTGAAGLLVSVAEPVKQAAASLGVDPLTVFAILGLCVGAYMLWRSFQRSREGWAQ